MRFELDKLLVKKGYYENISDAALDIRLGRVFVNNQKVIKPKTRFSEDSLIEVKESRKFVSRSGYKLEKAIEKFQIKIKGKYCLDIGAAEGGFTDCLLQKGAQKIVALEKGRNQLRLKLKECPGVLDFGGHDFNELANLGLGVFDLIAVDVTYAALEDVLKSVNKNVNQDTKILALIKPRFETDQPIVKHERSFYIDLLKQLFARLNCHSWHVTKLAASPVKGERHKNSEFLALLEQNKQNTREIEDTVDSTILS